MARVFRIVPFALVLLAALALCSTAWAQPGPGGRGPMGGGFIASPSALYPLLLNSATVQKDLHLLDEQKAKIKEALDKSRAAMRELRSGMGDLRDLPPEERTARVQKIRKKMQAQGEEASKALASILRPEQLSRLKGIALQRMAFSTISSDKDVQKDLKLTDDQVAKLKSIADDVRKKLGDLSNAGPGDDRNAMRQKMQDMMKGAETKVMDVLTADQKTALETMKGNKLDIPNSELRGGTGGGGGRRRGGGGGGNTPPRTG
jgi:Spy/CpxP family protein refolding chaperone